jgi:hypothetical protein
MMSDGKLDYQAICDLAAATGRTRESLIVLSEDNDPYYTRFTSEPENPLG